MTDAVAPVTVSLEAVGAPGLKQFGGYVQEEFHPDLRGTLANKIYREMGDNHPVINAALELVQLLITQTPKQVEASGSTADHLRAQLLCEQALEDVEGGADAVIGEALSCMQYGFATLEKVFKIRRGDQIIEELKSKFDDGLIGWRKIETRAQEALLRWDYSPQGQLRGFWQQPPPDYRTRYLPKEKFLHFRLRARKGNPQGRSMLRPVYLPYYFEKRLKFVEAVGVERNLAGLPKMTVPVEVLRGATTELAAVRETYESLVRRVRVDQQVGLLLPPEETPDGKKTGYKFDLVNSGGRNVADTDPIVRRYRSEIAIGLFAEFIIVGIDKVGSLALHSDKTALFALGVGAVLDTVLQVFTEDAFPELCRLNGIPASCAPKYTHGDVITPGLQDLAAYVGALAGVGAISIDDGLERYLREAGGMPAAPQRIAVQVPAAAPTGAPPRTPPPPGSALPQAA